MTFRSEQQATYRGRTPQEADDAFRADVDKAVARGFQPVSGDRREASGEHVLTVTYRYEPPPVIVRNYEGPNNDFASWWFATDAAAMAQAGYLPVTQSWGQPAPGVGRTLAIGLLAHSMRKTMLTVSYTYQPDRVPVTASLAPHAVPAHFWPGNQQG